MKSNIKSFFIVMIIVTAIMYILTCFFISSFNILICSQEVKGSVIFIWSILQLFNVGFYFNPFKYDDD